MILESFLFGQFDILFFGRGRSASGLQSLIGSFLNFRFFGRGDRGKTPGAIMQDADTNADINIARERIDDAVGDAY